MKMKKYARAVMPIVMAAGLAALPTAAWAQSDATLTNLVPSVGSLTPSFDSGTFSYTASVFNSVTNLTVTPTASDVLATITVNGSIVASGNASDPIGLSEGANVITNVVVSQDTTATNTYTLTVTRSAPASRWWDGGSVNIGGDGDGASTGGAGTWDTTIQNWDAGGSPHVAWNNFNNDTAIFGGAAGTVTLGAGITVGGVIIDTTANYTFQTSGIGGSGTLTKSGSGTLTLSSANTYSGGTVINAGTVAVGADNQLGAVAGGITFNGTPTFGNDGSWTIDAGRTITLNAGAKPSFNFGGGTIAGPVVGSGGFSVNKPSQGNPGLSLTSTNNTFTGAMNLPDKGAGGNASYTFNSMGDAPGADIISLGYGGQGSDFYWGSGAAAPLVLNYRKFDFGAGSINNNNTASSHANTITVNTDLLATGTGNRTLTLGGSNTGANTFAGKIANGANAVISLTKAGNGTWFLSGTNTYSGATTVSGGTLVLAGSKCLSDTANLTLQAGAKVRLEEKVKEMVGALYFGAVQQAAGSWGSSSSAADNKNDTYFLGSGVLYAGVEPPPDSPTDGAILIVK